MKCMSPLLIGPINVFYRNHGTGVLASGNELPAGSILLHDLGYMMGATTPDTILFSNDVTVNGTFSLAKMGTFAIGGHTLTVNDTIAGGPGHLVGDSTSSLVIAGTAANLSLPMDADSLKDLTINNPSGLIIPTACHIYGLYTQTQGKINVGRLYYHNNGSLRYNGTAVDITTDAEFPTFGSSEPLNVSFNNPAGVTLHKQRTINGDLYIGSADTLTLNDTNGINIMGNVHNYGVQRGSGAVVVDNGPASVLYGPGSFANLFIADTIGVTVSGSPRVQDTLRLETGSITIANSDSIFLESGALLDRKSGSLAKTPQFIGMAHVSYTGNTLATGPELSDTAATVIVNLANPSDSIMLSKTLLTDTLLVTQGKFRLGPNALHIGQWMDVTGQLGADATSSMYIGGSNRISLGNAAALGNLFVNNDSGVTVNSTAFLINDTLGLGKGTVNSVMGSLQYGPAGVLLFGG